MFWSFNLISSVGFWDLAVTGTLGTMINWIVTLPENRRIIVIPHAYSYSYLLAFCIFCFFFFANHVPNTPECDMKTGARDFCSLIPTSISPPSFPIFFFFFPALAFHIFLYFQFFSPLFHSFSSHLSFFFQTCPLLFIFLSCFLLFWGHFSPSLLHFLLPAFLSLSFFLWHFSFSFSLSLFPFILFSIFLKNSLHILSQPPCVFPFSK